MARNAGRSSRCFGVRYSDIIFFVLLLSCVLLVNWYSQSFLDVPQQQAVSSGPAAVLLGVPSAPTVARPTASNADARLRLAQAGPAPAAGPSSKAAATAPKAAGRFAPSGCFSGQVEAVALKPDLRAASCPGQREAHTAPLFVAITSPVGNFNLRKALREGSWLMSTFLNSDRASYMFFVGKGLNDAEDQKVAQEMQRFGDIVQLSLPDSYPNLAVKSVGAAAWMDALLDLSKVRFWLKVEDYMSNSFREIDKVVRELDERKESPTTPYYGGGMIFGGGQVMPDGRWGCPRRHCPYKTYPATYAGGQYLLNKAAVHIVATGLQGLNLKDPYPIEDHYVANTMLKAGFKVKDDRRLLWAGGKPYGAPNVIAKDYLLCEDTERKPDLNDGEDGAWEGGVLILPPGASVDKAWYGDPDPRFRWGSDRGKDVTDLVKKSAAKGSQIKAGGSGFGDPAPGTRKALFVVVRRAS